MSFLLDQTRRQFLGNSSTGIGTAALATLLNPGDSPGAQNPELAKQNGRLVDFPHQ
ncbi:MAG: twin-arginine translocation signal domain-containing protein, partial [Planctomycetota bacterium]|nr:twin-arginine translocation signal domain-containing protein [Planctomycetota bacterium]